VYVHIITWESTGLWLSFSLSLETQHTRYSILRWYQVPDTPYIMISSTGYGTFRYQAGLGTRYMIPRYPTYSDGTRYRIPHVPWYLSTRYGIFRYQAGLGTRYLIPQVLDALYQIWYLWDSCRSRYQVPCYPRYQAWYLWYQSEQSGYQLHDTYVLGTDT
jgi:hypothetical protein